AVMMKQVSYSDGAYRDADGLIITPAEIEQRFGAYILEHTLIRRIEKQHLDVDAVHWQKNLVLDSIEGQPLSFVTSRKQLPEPLPANWTVEPLTGTQVRVSLQGTCEVKVDSFRPLPVKSA